MNLQKKKEAELGNETIPFFQLLITVTPGGWHPVSQM